MDSVEAVVTQIQGLSGGSGDISLLHSLLKQADDLLHNESTRLAPFLEQLDPSIHTLGYLYLLCISLQEVERPSYTARSPHAGCSTNADSCSQASVCI
ncbi:COP9 signalosome complex subunit 3 [Vitis vinifera]|uniref:COP9 signalosome complex subunit 3 n=1 Tax=Vitis vinifera TaxID=29760 RepID=A0A438H728_VITVI|nr:COP9 signalosome complex subunit 3 [Vitis vinifera]RVW80354.1 COP9 signalosome complex subunit 3 [Vitis vinifera]